MVDSRSTIAGTYRGSGAVIECILDEGAPTYRGVTTMPDGQTVKVATWAAPLEEGQVVALSNDVANTYVATEGMPVVEVPVDSESLVIGQIVSTPKLKKFPSATDADDDTLAERLAGKYYRTALVEFHIPGRIVVGDIMLDGTRVVTPGVATTFTFNIAAAKATGARGYKFDQCADAHGVGCIPLHYIASGSDGDWASCLILLTGFLAAHTGTA